jgi:2-desacetyl-2-hydroxyethyl bacteriochlorophyllide A dehydrogenase
MRALVIDGVNQCVLQDIPRTEPGPGEVSIAVSHVGLCGSDLNTFRGANPLVKMPCIPGHEISGSIFAVGPGVDPELAFGVNVVVMPYTSCGTCSSCRKGRTNACRNNRTLGVQQEGGLREWLVVPADKVMVNRTLSLRRSALVEPLAVGFHAAARGQISKGDRVVVLGCGIIGVGAILAAAGRGAEVIAVDVSGSKEATVRRLGASHFINPSVSDLRATVRELTGGDGADVVIEAVGVPETFTDAIELACYAGCVVYVGYSKNPVTYDTQYFNLKELDIRGSRNATLQDFHDATRCIEKLGVDADLLISRVFPFHEAADALPWWQGVRSEVFKVMVEQV